ncbi:hypothetical protein DPMN_149486 [Dreissena polymorpha]|uniref:Uncharacterized protein n=1 Tax=Dreissena polymorpha TaxID=45954 RepID=A0A9D4FBF6_DREPO|nr:hypothetical protein DPMN_149486 [Dreissena polymorpha]
MFVLQVPPQVTLTIQQQVPVPAAPTSGDLVYQAIVLTHTLVRLEEEWLSNHPQLV